MKDSNEEYLKLITSEHATGVNYIKYVETFLKLLSPIVDNLLDFDIIFNLINAKGDQLDKIGEIVGISRILPLDNSSVSSVLSDDMYRRIIQSKILFNHWDGTREGLENILKTVFPEIPFVIVDNQDMSADIYIIDPEASQEFVTLLELGYIIPKPSGVRYNYYVLDYELFGWDSDTSLIRGWDEGKWR